MSEYQMRTYGTASNRYTIWATILSLTVIVKMMSELSGKKHFCTKDNVIKLSRILIRQKKKKSFDFFIPYFLSGSNESILSLFPFLI